jgi:hypothetical protein
MNTEGSSLGSSLTRAWILLRDVVLWRRCVDIFFALSVRQRKKGRTGLLGKFYGILVRLGVCADDITEGEKNASTTESNAKQIRICV